MAMFEKAVLNSVALRPVTLDDAEFIVWVRSDAVQKGYLSRGAENGAMQREWLRDYFARTNPSRERYFIVTEEGRRCGTLRVAELHEETDYFTWGSWCLEPGLHPRVAIASYILAQEVGFSNCRKRFAAFEVHKENSAVLAFHRRMGAIETGATRDSQLEFRLNREAYLISKDRWSSLFR